MTLGRSRRWRLFSDITLRFSTNFNDGIAYRRYHPLTTTFVHSHDYSHSFSTALVSQDSRGALATTVGDYFSRFTVYPTIFSGSWWRHSIFNDEKLSSPVATAVDNFRPRLLSDILITLNSRKKTGYPHLFSTFGAGSDYRRQLPPTVALGHFDYSQRLTVTIATTALLSESQRRRIFSTT